MPKKIKIIIFATLSVFLIGAFFYFHKLSRNKKVELSLTQNSEEQKVVEENTTEQTAVIDDEEKKDADASSQSSDDPLSLKLQRDEEKDVVADKLVIEDDTKVSKITKLSITNRLVSFGFQKAQNRKIDTIIIHSSYDALGDDPYSVSGVIAEYKSYGVSPHYLIDRKGNISRLVEDKNIAYHAGESKMSDGRTGVNAFSIGVEMLTTKKDKLTDAQYSALKLLISELKGKYEITSVLGHNQIAPGRKDDPWNFEWSKLK
ncbi:MAG: N-acetylmuramoyl-L-alanine amidase [Candidatus Moraniibacteriota bacterium]